MSNGSYYPNVLSCIYQVGQMRFLHSDTVQDATALKRLRLLIINEAYRILFMGDNKVYTYGMV